MIANQIPEVNFSSLTWSYVISQPLISIRLSAYLLESRNLKGLGSSSFARHYSRNHFLFSLPHPTKMFQFRWFPPNFLFYSEAGDTAWPVPGFPIRRSSDWRLLTATRSLSQSSTSFIGNIRLGIHLVPLSTFLCIDLTSNCYSQFLLPSIKNSISLLQIVNDQCLNLSTHFDS